MGEVNLGKGVIKIRCLFIRKTYEVATDDVRDVPRAEFIEDPECVVEIPPF